MFIKIVDFFLIVENIRIALLFATAISILECHLMDGNCGLK